MQDEIGRTYSMHGMKEREKSLLLLESDQNHHAGDRVETNSYASLSVCADKLLPMLTISDPCSEIMHQLSQLFYKTKKYFT
jgi:hypothetical protein